MLFNSYEFIFLFLPITLLLFFCLLKKQEFKLATFFLVIASLVFYAQWNVYYLPLLVSSILFNYVMGKNIEKTKTRKLLILGIIVNLSLLGYFKYTGFLLESINVFFETDLSIPRIILPLGISFFTFTQTAYLIDAYRGETKKYSLLTYSLFVTIFPHLIAGPILYHKDMIPQFTKVKNFALSYKNLSVGLIIFVIGLFKKVVIADTLAPSVNLIFTHANELNFVEAWIGALGYTLQLYFDFSGYSEMAVGLGMMLNFRLPINFNSPYKATSIIDFWRRWHITLSEFLKNYLYIPLGGNRHGEFLKMRNLFLTMFLGGLWHGAGWTFIIWGALHGMYLMINHQWKKLNIKLYRWFSWGITFLSVVIAWVFFKADTVHTALLFIKAMFKFEMVDLTGLGYGIGKTEIGYLLISFFWALYLKNTQERISDFKPNINWLLITVVLLFVSLWKMNQKTEFLYFQF